MYIKLAGWIGIALLGIIASTALWYFLFAQNTTSQVTQQTTVTLPSSSYSTTSLQQAVPPMTVATQNGSAIAANDFIHNGVTTPDPSNAGNYYLTGSSTNGYAIGYRVTSQFFTIALEQEPLGETRVAAENFLLSALGINKSQACGLNYYVGTDVYVNNLYAGKNLGFSFCPGATALPK